MKKKSLHANTQNFSFFDDFLYCGFLGWITEILFTACNTLKRRDYSLKGITSLWMFPIYGLSACLYPIAAFLKKHRVRTSVRGLLYTLCIFMIEFLSGSMLSKRKRCPWNYYRSPYHVRGVIRLDYAPCWFGFSLLMEKLLLRRHNADTLTRKNRDFYK
ncbi:MAG: hypothetical protein NC254_10525 [bacterium]|nr:hypothetical protein [bacterium]